MRIIIILTVLLTVWAVPALAQTAPDSARQNHLDLAGRYLTLTQGGDLVKQMRKQIEEQYSQSGYLAEQRDWMVANFSDVLAEVMEATIVELRDDVADSFTVQELEAAIAFYDSPLGRSVVRKQVDINLELEAVMVPLLMPRVQGLMEKFCLRFDCSALGEAAAKQGR